MVNKVILVGNLGTDPEVKTFESGNSVANFALATSERYTDKSGEKVEETEWHSCSCFGKLAELAEKYLAKGKKVYIEGKLKTRKWEDQETGQERYKTEIIVRELKFLSPINESSDDEGGIV